MRKLYPSGHAASISRRQNTGNIPGKKSAANKRVYTVANSVKFCCLYPHTGEPTLKTVAVAYRVN